MKIEDLIEQKIEVSASMIAKCDPFVLYITSFYPSGSGTDRTVHFEENKDVYPYRNVNYSEAAQAINTPRKFKSKFVFKSEIASW
ncbi:MAG: hypothetical protein RL755_32 [Pseudomonadota bacterium]|jgi:hypothetical protein